MLDETNETISLLTFKYMYIYVKVKKKRIKVVKVTEMILLIREIVPRYLS